MEVDATIQYTRYFYIKHHVCNCLIWSLFEFKMDEALFWAYELYFSGFDPTPLLYELCDIFYKDLHPELKTVFQQIPTVDVKVGMIIKTLVTCNISFTGLLRRTPMTQKDNINNVVCETMTDTELELYQTQSVDEYEYRSWKFLKEVARYPIRPRFIQMASDAVCIRLPKTLYDTSNEPYIKPLHLYDVPTIYYYASFTPLWLQRIHQYNGIVENEEECIRFPYEDGTEEFNNVFNYEHDEQSLETQKSIWCPKIEFISWSQFCDEYGEYNVFMRDIVIRKISC